MAPLQRVSRIVPKVHRVKYSLICINCKNTTTDHFLSMNRPHHKDVAIDVRVFLYLGNNNDIFCVHKHQ